MKSKSNVASPQHLFSSLRRHSLQGSTTKNSSANGDLRVSEQPLNQPTAVKFTINTDLVQIGTRPKVFHNNTAIYAPIQSAGSGRGGDLSQVNFMVEIKLLNDEQEALLIEVNGTASGQWLFDEVINRLGSLLERDYFGLRYLDKSKQRQWLDLSKTVYKQLKIVTPRTLNFRVKHYPARPLEELKQEQSRYFLYLQLRRDLHSGRLIGRNNEMHIFAAYILQAEIGDNDKLEVYLGKNGSLADLKMFENMTPRVEAKIRELHKDLQGLSVDEAEAKFLERASELETYGVEPTFVQDRKGNHFYVGLSHEGVVAFRGNRQAHLFSWTKIHHISYDGKLFVIQVEWEQRRHTLGFKCQTTEAAEALWKWAVDRQCFFTLTRSTDAKKSKANSRLFRKRQSYSFTGRCQREMLQMTSSMPNIPQPNVSRSRSLLNIAKSVSCSQQTRSNDQLNRPHQDSTNYHSSENLNSYRSSSVDAFLPESIEHLKRRSSEVTNRNHYTRMYRSGDGISPIVSLPVTTCANEDLSPSISMAWSPMPSRKTDALIELANNEVEKVLTHSEIMRLVAFRQNDDKEPMKGVFTNEMPNNKEAEKNALPSLPALGKNEMNVDREERSKEKNEKRLSHQSSVDLLPQNCSSTTSESFSTEMHFSKSSKTVLECADTIPTESTPLSSSTTPPSSPKPEMDLLTNSTAVDPPSSFADVPSQKNLYFPYLSKVRNFEQDGGYQETVCRPLLSAGHAMDSLTLQSRPDDINFGLNRSFDPYTYSTGTTGTTEPYSMNDSLQRGCSSLLLCHGYTTYRGYEVNGTQNSHGDSNEDCKVGLRPAMVKAGCAPAEEEPIIVAECYVPLCADDEDDEDDENKSEAGVAEIAESSDVGTGPFDWSAASARVNKCLLSDPQKTARHPPMTAVVLSQEITTPIMKPINHNVKAVDPVQHTSIESNAKKPEGSHLCNKRAEMSSAFQPKVEIIEEKSDVPVLRCVGMNKHELLNEEPALQRTQIQIIKTESVEEKRVHQWTSSHRTATISGQTHSSALSQIFWLVLVFLAVHNLLKIIRVGPILGFFGATGPNAVGYWSALEAFIDFIFFQLF